MIDPKVIEKCQKIANDKKVKNLPKYFDISEFLFSNRFSGDRFLSLDAKLSAYFRYFLMFMLVI